MKNILFTFLITTICFFRSFSQGSADYGSGMKLNLNPEGSKYIRFIAWNQIWFRASQLNPGSAVGGEQINTNYDIGARRIRMLAMAQVSNRYMILTHFGINNQTFINGGGSGSSGTGGYGAGKKPQIFFHDVWNEYAVILPGKQNKNTSLTLGGGLHYFMGISRMTQASTLNFLTVDSPIFSWANIEASDQFARQFGIFAKGKLDRLEYRLALNKPFATNLVPTTETAVDNSGKTAFAKTGYLEYHFWDIESNVLPYKVGTYLGTRKVFNVGAGFYTQPKGTRSLNNGSEKAHDVNLLAVDAFMDLPVGNKDRNMAVTAYAGFFNYNFGPDYLRNIGIMNPAVAAADYSGPDRLLSGAGNVQPMIGTGNIFYAQAGLLLPKYSEKPKVRVQPFAAFTHKDFEALQVGLNNFDVGANWLIDGHHAKITTQYSLRPGIEAASGKKRSFGEFIAQLQIYL
jgi:hypothetical protein